MLYQPLLFTYFSCPLLDSGMENSESGTKGLEAIRVTNTLEDVRRTQRSSVNNIIISPFGDS